MIKILFLAANPSDTTRLRLAEEIRAIDEKLRQTEYRDNFDIQQQWAVRVSDLEGYLLRHKPDIVHFSGHGSNESKIIIEDNLGKSYPVSVEALSRLFSIFKENIRCVVLNACYSEPQARTIAMHIDYVIGMSQAITDAAAISFASAFYQALGYGTGVKTAFELGCTQIFLENLPEKDTPKLLTYKRLAKLSSIQTNWLIQSEDVSSPIEYTFNQLNNTVASLSILSLLNSLPQGSLGLRIGDICRILCIQKRKTVALALMNMEINGQVIKTKQGKSAFWHISESGEEELKRLEERIPIQIVTKKKAE